MNTLRKSLRLKRNKSGRVELQTTSLSETTPNSPKQKKQLGSSVFSQSFRTLTRTNSSRKKSNELEVKTNNEEVIVPNPQTLKLPNARKDLICFFRAGSKQENIEFRTIIGLKLAKQSGNTMKTFNKISKNTATCIIGDGRIKFISVTQISEEYSFELNHIENIHLASSKSKEVLMTFKGDSEIYFIKCDNNGTAQLLIRHIFIELRRICYILNRILNNILPEQFRISNKIEDLLIQQKDKILIDITLRELVDISLFARGPSSITFVEATNNFSKFLLSIGNEEEGNYWQTISKQANKAIEKRLEQPKKISNKHILHEIRNPIDLDEQVLLKTQSVPPNVDSLCKRIEDGIKHSAQALKR